MKHSVFGSPDGSIVMYFHGVPGAISEAQLFDDSAKENGLKIICQDRLALDAHFTKSEYFQTLADDICRLAQGKKGDIVAFSIGAFVALQVWRLIPHQVRSLHLVSPAAAATQATSKLDLMGKEALLFMVSVPDEWAVEEKSTSRLLQWVLELIRVGVQYLGNLEQAPVTVAFAHHLDVHG